MGAQQRNVSLGPAAMLERLDASGHPAGLAGAVNAPSAAFAFEALAQGEIDLEQVDRLEGRRLVEDFPRGVLDCR
jgi:hypothetical protein